MVLPRLRELREDANLSQAEVASIVGITQSTYSSYENGSVKNIPLDALVKLCKFYHVSSDYLLGLSDRPSSS